MKTKVSIGDIYCLNNESDEFHTYGKNYIVMGCIDSNNIQITCDEEDYRYVITLSALGTYFKKVEKTPVLLIEELFNSI